MREPPHIYVIALGSNMRHAQIGGPRQVLSRAVLALAEIGEVKRCSKLIESAPIGPSLRRYVNGACILESKLEPLALLARLKEIERDFGRKSRGQRWRARVLDLDIILWSGGIYRSKTLTIPHREMRVRRFVLGPVSVIAPRWRDPITKLSLKHLHIRLTKAHPARSGAAVPMRISHIGGP